MIKLMHFGFKVGCCDVGNQRMSGAVNDSLLTPKKFPYLNLLHEAIICLANITLQYSYSDQLYIQTKCKSHMIKCIIRWLMREISTLLMPRKISGLPVASDCTQQVQIQKGFRM